jgi:hypothetical protein
MRRPALLRLTGGRPEAVAIGHVAPHGEPRAGGEREETGEPGRAHDRSRGADAGREIREGGERAAQRGAEGLDLQEAAARGEGRGAREQAAVPPGGGGGGEPRERGTRLAHTTGERGRAVGAGGQEEDGPDAAHDKLEEAHNGPLRGRGGAGAGRGRVGGGRLYGPREGRGPSDVEFVGALLRAWHALCS